MRKPLVKLNIPESMQYPGVTSVTFVIPITLN